MLNNNMFHGWNSAEPIGLEYLYATLSGAGFICVFVNHYELQVRGLGQPKILSYISGMSCEWSAILETARIAKNKGHITIVGGYHVCGNWQHINNECIDRIIVGEGEEVSVMLAKVLLHGESVDFYGKVYNRDNLPRVIHAPRIKDIDALPLPARSKERLGTYILYDLMWPPTSLQKNTSIVLTSRGCKHNCDFCASSTVWGQGVRFRTTENIITELRELKERFSTNTIIIIDQSFGQVIKWTLDVCEAIKKANLGINWYHQSNLDIDRDVIQAMAEAGCTKIGFGLEGISPTAIRKIKPINPFEMDKINDIFDYCRSLGLFVKAYLMIGYPWEDRGIIEEYKNWVTKIRASQIKISYMTPFPGTKYWEMYSNSLLIRDWSCFDTVKMPVIYNPYIGVEEYHGIRQELFNLFYSSSTYAQITNEMLKKYPHYIQSYKEFCLYLKSNNMITGNEPWLEWVGFSGNSDIALMEDASCNS